MQMIPHTYICTEKRQLQKKTYVHVGAEDMKREIYHPLNVFPEKVGLRTRLESMKDGM